MMEEFSETSEPQPETLVRRLPKKWLEIGLLILGGLALIAISASVGHWYGRKQVVQVPLKEEEPKENLIESVFIDNSQLVVKYKDGSERLPFPDLRLEILLSFAEDEEVAYLLELERWSPTKIIKVDLREGKAEVVKSVYDPKLKEEGVYGITSYRAGVDRTGNNVAFSVEPVGIGACEGCSGEMAETPECQKCFAETRRAAAALAKSPAAGLFVYNIPENKLYRLVGSEKGGISFVWYGGALYWDFDSSPSYRPSWSRSSLERNLPDLMEF